MTPKVSVIVAIYKVEAYLAECIESILAQTFSEIEIILVDDGSPDNSGKICDAYAEKDERIRVIHQENAGVSVARNNGIDAATTDWIVMVDGDDWLTKDAIEILYQAIISEAKCDVLVGTHYSNSSKGEKFSGEKRQLGELHRYDMSVDRKKILSYTLEEVEAPELREMGCNLSSPWAKIYRKSMLNQYQIRFVPGQRRAQDEIFNLYALQYAREVIVLNRPVYHYRIQENSTCASLATAKFSRGIFDVWSQETTKFMNQFGYQHSLADLYNLYAYRLLMQMLRICICNYVDGIATRTETIQQLRGITEMQIYQDGIVKSKHRKYLSLSQKCLIRAFKMKQYFWIVTLSSVKVRRSKKKHEKNGTYFRV